MDGGGEMFDDDPSPEWDREKKNCREKDFSYVRAKTIFVDFFAL